MAIKWDKTLYETKEECPSCKFTKENYRSLELLYSSCCGNIRCLGCINSLYFQNILNRCPKCQTNLKRGDYKHDPLFRQNYYKEIKFRKELEDISTFNKEDFKNISLFNDYLELKANYIYVNVYGTKKSRIEINKKMLQFRDENNCKQICSNVKLKKPKIEDEEEYKLYRMKLAGGYKNDYEEEKMDYEFKLWI